jgi:large repetitive protein
MTLDVRVTDAGLHELTRTIQVRKATATAGGVPTTPAQPVVPRTTSSTGHRVVVTAQTTTHATVALRPDDGGDIAWSWPGGSATGATAEIPVAAGATVAVTAVRTVTPANVEPFSAYMLFKRPTAAEFPSGPSTDWALNPTSMGSSPASSRDGWGGAQPFLGADSIARLAQIPKNTPITVEGFASYEGRDDPDTVDRNLRLSERRRDALVHVLTTHKELLFTNVTAGDAHGHEDAKNASGTDPAPGSSAWRRATAKVTPASPSTETITAELTRPSAPTVTDVDPEPQRPLVPDCFRKLGVRVELIRGTFVRAEVYGEFDVRTAAEARLDEHTSDELPARTNPSDGICTFLVRLRIAEDRSSWLVSAEFRAIEGDLDGLAKVDRSATGSNTALNILGAVSALSPLLAAATPPSPTAGELVPLVVLGSAALGLPAAGQIQTQYVVLRGGELMVTDGLVDPATGSGPNTTQVSVLLDLETAFSFDLGFIRVDPAKPIVTRYKAVGVRSSWDTATDGNEIEYIPLPVFDPSRGYTLDVPAGSLAAAPPLDALLRVLGVRASRLNPTYLEIEVGLGVDLGIVIVDTVRVRLRLDAVEAPQLTKLGATLDIPGAIHGVGYLEITEFGFKGAFDLTFPSVGLRAAATLALESRSGTTGVLVGAEVEFPVPLPLGNSGLGIFGFLGGVGVNYRRLEPTGVQAPALRWLESQLTPARGFNVMHPAGWELNPGSFAIAAGVMLGTAEGGFLIHLKGIVLIEVPGPRLMLMMKADVLKLPPVLKSQSSATFLAVLDLDFGRGTITIGIVAEYDVVHLLHIRVPVTAFFHLSQSQNWFIDLGSHTEPVTLKVLDVFSGTGYLMIHGDGTTLANPQLPIVTSGLAIAVGFHLQCVLMGSKSVGLYFEVAAGFDALVSFEPFAIGGKIYARGELRLWVVGVSAKAELTVLVGRQLENGTEVERTYIHGEVCGKVDLFFFDIEGCIELTIGESEPSPPAAPQLVAGVTLVSRSPALVEGSATDRAVDGALADALDENSTEPLPTVPLDAIPVVLFEVPPMVAPGNIVLGGEARGESGVGADPWVRRGDRWWRYQLTGVELVGNVQPAPPTGKTPATWWARNAPGQSQLGPALALLSWLPTPTPRAVPYGESLTTSVEERWGHICSDVAPPAPVLWTLDGKPVGPNPAGWRLEGVPWPDPADAFRTSPVAAKLGITEAWRAGNALADLLQGTDPATVVGDAVSCPTGRIQQVDSVHVWDDGNPLSYGNAAMPTSGDALGDVLELMAAGASLADLAARWVDTAWDREMSGKPLECQGRVLRSPSGDEPHPAPYATEPERELVKQVWDETGFTPSEFANTLRLRCDDGFEALELLLLVSERMLNEGLVVTCRDAKGNVVAQQPVTGDSMVTPSNPLPGNWTDPAGPWADPIERAGRLAARVVANQRDLLMCRVVVDVPGVPLVEIGADRREEHLVGTTFWVVAAVGLTSSERWRYEYDSTVVTTERDLLESTPSQDPTESPYWCRRRTTRSGSAGAPSRCSRRPNRPRPRRRTGVPRRPRSFGSPRTDRTRHRSISAAGCWPAHRR